MTLAPLTDRTRRIKDVLWVLAFAGLVAMVLRFLFGLGATTALTDQVPWGLWKIFNMVAGAALATSGFTVGFLGHVLHIKPFDKLVKPAVLVAFLGYGSSLFALLFDIGLPWRFWHPFVFWNPHSFLFEVFWCVSFYFLVTFLEFSPTLLERIGLKPLRRWLRRGAGVFVIVGITLSSLHHTSLGSLFLVTPQRLHTLWYSPILPLLFILSAMGGGLMVLALIKVLYAYWYNPESVFTSSGGTRQPLFRTCTRDSNGHPHFGPPDLPQVRALVIAGSLVLALHGLFKLGDLLLRPDARAALLMGTWESALYAVEWLLSIVVPLVLVAIPAVRRSAAAMATAGGLAAAGLALNRMNAGIFGYFRDAGEVYFPSAIEWTITAGVLAMAGLAFFFLVEQFSVFDERWRDYGKGELPLTSAFDRLTHVWHHRLLTGLERVSLIGLFVIPLAFIALNPSFHGGEDNGVQPPLAVDAARDTLRLDGNRHGIDAVFAHAAHQQRLGGDHSCASCHHLSAPTDKATPCGVCHSAMETASDLFDHNAHTGWVADDMALGGLHPENHSCRECHGLAPARSASNAKACLDCHHDDMHPVDPPAGSLAQQHASSYHHAMHQTCIPCHSGMIDLVGRAELDRCTTCHDFHDEPPPVSPTPPNRELVDIRL